MANGQKVVVTNLDDLEGLSLSVGSISGNVPAVGRLYVVPPTAIPGITAADALDANDQFGSLLTVAVPKRGAIVKAKLHDLDNEGLGVEMWVFSNSVTLAANDAAYALSDADNLQVVDIITFATFKTATNNQIGLTADTPAWYDAPNGNLYLGFKSLGTPNIAAGSMPQISMLIERYADD